MYVLGGCGHISSPFEGGYPERLICNGRVPVHFATPPSLKRAGSGATFHGRHYLPLAMSSLCNAVVRLTR